MITLLADCVVNPQETWQQDAVVAGAFVLIALIIVVGIVYAQKNDR